MSRSPHHNGQNDTGKRYLDIRYALRGNSHRGESIEERIDAMAELADAPPIATQTRSAAEEDRIRVLKAVCGRVASEKRDDVKAAAKELADRWGIIVHFQRDRYGNPEVARFEEAR